MSKILVLSLFLVCIFETIRASSRVSDEWESSERTGRQETDISLESCPKLFEMEQDKKITKTIPVEEGSGFRSNSQVSCSKPSSLRTTSERDFKKSRGATPKISKKEELTPQYVYKRMYKILSTSFKPILKVYKAKIIHYIKTKIDKTGCDDREDIINTLINNLFNYDLRTLQLSDTLPDQEDHYDIHQEISRILAKLLKVRELPKIWPQFMKDREALDIRVATKLAETGYYLHIAEFLRRPDELLQMTLLKSLRKPLYGIMEKFSEEIRGYICLLPITMEDMSSFLNPKGKCVPGRTIHKVFIQHIEKSLIQWNREAELIKDDVLKAKKMDQVMSMKESLSLVKGKAAKKQIVDDALMMAFIEKRKEEVFQDILQYLIQCMPFFSNLLQNYRFTDKLQTVFLSVEEPAMMEYPDSFIEFVGTLITKDFDKAYYQMDPHESNPKISEPLSVTALRKAGNIIALQKGVAPSQTLLFVSILQKRLTKLPIFIPYGLLDINISTSDYFYTRLKDFLTELLEAFPYLCSANQCVVEILKLHEHYSHYVLGKKKLKENRAKFEMVMEASLNKALEKIISQSNEEMQNVIETTKSLTNALSFASSIDSNKELEQFVDDIDHLVQKTTELNLQIPSIFRGGEQEGTKTSCIEIENKNKGQDFGVLNGFVEKERKEQEGKEREEKNKGSEEYDSSPFIPIYPSHDIIKAIEHDLITGITTSLLDQTEYNESTRSEGKKGKKKKSKKKKNITTVQVSSEKMV